MLGADVATEAERNRGAGAYTTPGVDVKSDLAPSPIITSSPVVRFKLIDIDPPGFVYINREDQLQVFADGLSFAGAVVEFSVRILRTDGTIVASAFDLTLQGNGNQV